MAEEGTVSACRALTGKNEPPHLISDLLCPAFAEY